LLVVTGIDSARWEQIVWGEIRPATNGAFCAFSIDPFSSSEDELLLADDESANGTPPVAPVLLPFFFCTRTAAEAADERSCC
jgi:hypothetical protein